MRTRKDSSWGGLGLDSSHCSRGLGLEARRTRNESSPLITGTRYNTGIN